MLKKSLTYLYIIVLLLVVYLLQVFVIDTKTLFGVKPNLILITTIVVSLWFGMYTGTIYSFIIGFVTDLVFGNAYGLFTISYTVVGLIVGLMHENYRRDNKLSLVYVTLLATAIFEVIEYIQYVISFQVYANIFYLIKQIFISSVLNIIIVYIVYGAIYKIVDYFESNLKRNNTVF